jgi:hypothetical protein
MQLLPIGNNRRKTSSIKQLRIERAARIALNPAMGMQQQGLRTAGRSGDRDG